MPSKLTQDFRMGFAMIYLIIAGIFLFTQKENLVELNDNNNGRKLFWCLTFCLFGFGLLILKVCINSLTKNPEDDTIERKKKILRYCFYYPIMLFAMSVLSTVISVSQFNKSENYFLVSSALLSFFLGFFVDSLSNIVEGVGKKLGGKD